MLNIFKALRERRAKQKAAVDAAPARHTLTDRERQEFLEEINRRHEAQFDFDEDGNKLPDLVIRMRWAQYGADQARDWHKWYWGKAYAELGLELE